MSWVERAEIERERVDKMMTVMRRARNALESITGAAHIAYTSCGAHKHTERKGEAPKAMVIWGNH